MNCTAMHSMRSPHMDLRYMMVLEEQHPDVISEFHKGNFVIHKSRRDLSAMAIDQAHEQNNAVIKGDGVLLA